MSASWPSRRRESAALRAVLRRPPLLRRCSRSPPTGAAPLREQHLGPVQPLARAGRRRLARSADLVHGRDRARRRRLARRRKRSCSAPITTGTSSTSSTCSTGRRLARAADGRAAGAALRRRHRVVAGRDEVRVRGERAHAHGHGGLGSRRRRRARRVPVFGEGMFAFPAAGRPTGRSCSSLDFRNNSDASIHLVDVETGDTRELTPHEDEATVHSRAVGARRLGLLPLTDEGSEFRGLAFYDLATDRYEWVEEPTQDVEDVDRVATTAACSPGSSTRTATTVCVSATSRPASDLPEPELPDGVASAPHRRGAAARAFARRLARSADLCDARGGRPRSGSSRRRPATRAPVTDSRIGGLREDDLVDVELVSYPDASTGARSRPGSTARRRRARCRSSSRSTAGPRRRSARLPAALPVPRSVAGHRACWRRTSAARRATARRTRRSSSATGAAATCRTGSTRSSGCSEQDWVDAGPDRRLRRLVRRLRGADVRDAPAASTGRRRSTSSGRRNLVTFAKAVPPTWRRFMARFVGDPETEADFLMERSPITYVENVRTPLLVIQGANDPRVVKGESDQLVERLQRARPRGRVRRLRRRGPRVHEARERAEGVPASPPTGSSST